MPGTSRIATQDIFETAKVVETLGQDLTFKQALDLCMIVLRFDGGPLPRRGKKAPTDARTIGILERRGYLEPGGDQYGATMRVTSVPDHSARDAGWTASSSPFGRGRMTAVISASEEGRTLVRSAWDQREQERRG